MSSCPYCRTDNIGDTVNRGISQCHDCGAEFRGDTVFTEGSYRTFMENVLNKIAEAMEPRTASMVLSIRDNALNDKNDIDSIVEKLMDITETVNADNTVGINRTNDVVDLVEGLEKITTFAKVLAKNAEISERTAFRLALLEGTDPASWMYPPGEIPDLPGEISDIQPPSASDIVSSQEPPVPAGSPAVDKVYQEGMWMGEKVKFNVTEADGVVKYDVRTMDESPIISYNEETQSHDGIDQFTEEQLAELDNVMSEFNKDVMSSMSKEYGADKAKQVYYATANKQDRNPENFHKVDEVGGAEGTVVSTETSDPGAEAAQLSAPMMQQGSDMVHDQGAVDEGAKSTVDDKAAEELKLFIDNDGNLYRRQFQPIINNLQKKIKRGVYDSELAVKAFANLAYSGARAYAEQHGGDISTFSKATRLEVAKALRDGFESEYMPEHPTEEAAPAVDGPLGAPAAQVAPSVDGGIGAPVVDEASPEVDGPVGQPVDGTCQVDGPVGEPIVDETGAEGVIAPEGELGAELGGEEELEVLGKPAEDEEHEEAEADAIEVVGTKAEKAQAKIETAEAAIEALKDAVDELSNLEKDGSEDAPAGEGEALVADGEDKPKEDAGEETDDADDDLGEVEPVEGDDEDAEDDKEKIEELEKKKTKAGFELVGRPVAVPSTREVDGKKPTGHIVGYVQSKHDPSKSPSEQWSEEEAPVPLTQAEADKDLVDENGVKVKKPDYSNTKDDDMDKLDKKTFDKNRIDAKKLDEVARFNGFRLGDHIKVPGYSKSFELTKITTEPSVRFHLQEGRVSITLDPNSDQFELDEDKDIKWQRTTSIIEDTRATWEDMEKEFIKEGCAGGVCSIGSPLAVQNTTSGIGTVMSAMPVFTKTPIRTIPAEVSDKDIYAYIKNNNLHTVAREAALGQVKGNFLNSESDVEKIYEDAVASLKYEAREDTINEVDASYGYKTESNRTVEIDRSLNEGYDRLKELGIV